MDGKDVAMQDENAESRSPPSSEDEFVDCESKAATDGVANVCETLNKMQTSNANSVGRGTGPLGPGGTTLMEEPPSIEKLQKQMWEEMESYADSNSVPQVAPLSANQVMNNAGGYVYAVSDRVKIRRFLILGTCGGTYYVKEDELTLENAQDIIRMIENDGGEDILLEIHEINQTNRAPKQLPLIFCLALLARYPTNPTDRFVRHKSMAYDMLQSVCRIPTHLFQFADFSEKVGGGKTTGWGRAHRDSISKWYLKKDPMALAMAVTKYQQRNGWSHRDLLRLSHPKTGGGHGNATTVHDDLFMYCVKGYNAMLERRQEFLAPANEANDVEDVKRLKDEAPNYLKFLEAVELMKKCKDEKTAAKLIEQFNLVREHVPTDLLNSQIVWRTLLKRMPMTAMIRNLGKMTSIELLKNKGEESKLVCEKLLDESALRSAHIHPLNVLMALTVYRSGHGDKGNLKWEPNESIVNALNESFYKSFANVKSTNKKFLLAFDVSGSMSAWIAGTALSCAEASAAMAMITLRTEPLCEVVAFQNELTELKLKKEMKLDEVLEITRDLNFGMTDCALPMLWAAQNKKIFDCFIVYTDCETYFGDVHPSEAMRLYRQKSGVWNAKLIVVGMTATKFTIADPNDPFMLDIVGFDSAAPELIRNFILDWDSAPKPTDDEVRAALQHVVVNESDD